jgi:hypothetical protein
MELQIYLCFFAPVVVAIIIIWLSRYLSHGEPDSAAQTKLAESQRLNQESGIEAYRIRETARESKTTVDRIRERESEARESVELAESAVREAHQDNRRAEAIIEESLAIIETAEKKE